MFGRALRISSLCCIAGIVHSRTSDGMVYIYLPDMIDTIKLLVICELFFLMAFTAMCRLRSILVECRPGMVEGEKTWSNCLRINQYKFVLETSKLGRIKNRTLFNCINGYDNLFLFLFGAIWLIFLSRPK